MINLNFLFVLIINDYLLLRTIFKIFRVQVKIKWIRTKIEHEFGYGKLELFFFFFGDLGC